MTVYTFEYKKSRTAIISRDRFPLNATATVNVTVEKSDGIHHIREINYAGVDVLPLLLVYSPETVEAIRNFGIRHHYKSKPVTNDRARHF